MRILLLSILSFCFLGCLPQGKAQDLLSLTDATQRKYENVRAFLKDLAAKYPENASVISIGISDTGKPIEALKIGNGPVADLIVATHHGNEYGSTEVALATARDMAEKPLEGKTIYVLPVLNQSGYDKKNRYENAANSSFDPNRDYEGPCGTEGPWHLKSTRALANFIADKNIVASATMHTYWPAVVYPWGNSASNYSTPYDNLFIDLAKSATFMSHYATGFSGEAIYPADGTFEDYAFWKQGIWSLLFEIGESHSPDQAAVDEMIRTNVPGLRKMMDDSQTTRAVDHAFNTTCTANKAFDPHIE